MSNLSLEQIFGTGVTQDVDKITIQKSSLMITPLSNNTAESLLVGILIKAIESFRGNLTDISGNKITDISGNSITYNQTPLYEFLDVFMWRINFSSGYKIHRLVMLEYTLYVD